MIFLKNRIPHKHIDLYFNMKYSLSTTVVWNISHKLEAWCVRYGHNKTQLWFRIQSSFLFPVSQVKAVSGLCLWSLLKLDNWLQRELFNIQKEH